LAACLASFVINYQKDTGYQSNTTMLTCPGSASKSSHQAVRDTLDVVSGKWKLIILAVLLERKYRFKELSREIGISPRILSKELQELELHQLVKRTVCATRPVTVEYESTAHSQTLLPVVQAMSDWGYLHYAAIVGQPRPDAPAPTA
jgi:DNA-binding HxlR family transcriptional regulator